MIKKILNDNSLRNKIVEAGYRRLKNFSWKKCAQETSKIYESLI